VLHAAPAGDTALWLMFQPLLMSKSAYDGLDDKQKAALDEAAGKAQACYLDEAKKHDAQSVEAFKKVFVEIKNMAADEFKAWQDIAKESSCKTFAEQTPDGQKLVDLALSVE